MNATDELIRLDPALKVVEYAGPMWKSFDQTDVDIVGVPSGIDIEEGEFLYGLVRIMKPHFMLETGTNTAISARYAGLAMKANGFGLLHTLEHDFTVFQVASQKIHQSGLQEHVACFNCKVEDYVVDDSQKIDMLWLDTEPLERYAELIRFFPDVEDNGIICVHDLEWPDVTGVFGKVPEELQDLMLDGKLRVMTFPTYRNLTVFQKVTD